MVSEQQLQDWKVAWRELLIEGIGQALKAMEERIPEAATKHNALLAMKARLNETNQKKVMGVLSAEQLQLQYNQLRHDILIFIDELTPADLEAARTPMGSAPDQPRRGALLHKIPRQMAIGKEEECIIRLAYDRMVIANDLEITEAVEVKEIIISKVMQAELIDPNENAAFSIRTFSDEEQFLQEGEYTQWRFYVKPLREGAFPLLLKITVVEMIDGLERLRNISWQETIQIVATEKPTAEAAFEKTGINLSFEKQSPDRSVPPLSPLEDKVSDGQSWITIEQEEVSAGDTSPPPSPRIVNPSASGNKKPAAQSGGAPRIEPAPLPPRARRSSRMRGFSIAASVVIVIGLAMFLWVPGFQSSDTTSPGSKVEDVDRNPNEGGGLVEPEPISAEENAWQTVTDANTVGAYKTFIKSFPESKYVEEAREKIKELGD